MGEGAVRGFTGRRATSNTWFGLVLLAAGVGMATLLVVEPGEDFGYLVVVAALTLVAGAAVLVVDARRARKVSASQDGLTLTDGIGRQRVIPWQSVRRVRTRTELGFPCRDEHLDLVDGDLVALPSRLPDGSVERWRQELAVPATAPEPSGSGERVWRIPVTKVPDWVVLLQVPNLAFLVSGPWGGYSLVLLVVLLSVAAVVLGVSYRQDRREVRADCDGLALPRFRGPLRIGWADITAVGGTSGRWDDEPRIELRDGTTVPIPFTVPATVVARWRDELAPRPI